MADGASGVAPVVGGLLEVHHRATEAAEGHGGSPSIGVHRFFLCSVGDGCGSVLLRGLRASVVKGRPGSVK
jgi:hypothetical protein